MIVLGGVMLTLAYGVAAALVGVAALLCLWFTLYAIEGLLDFIVLIRGVCRRFTPCERPFTARVVRGRRKSWISRGRSAGTPPAE